MTEMAFLVLFGLALTSRHQRRSLVCYVLLVVVGYSLYLTFSRGSWAALAVGCVVFLLFSVRQVRWKRAAAMTALALVFLGLAGGLFDGPLIGERSTRDWRDVAGAVQSRSTIWEEFLDVTDKKPLLGVGFGQETFTADEGRTNAHSSPLGMWSGAGFAAFLIMVGFLVVHGLHLWRARAQLNRDELWGNVLVATYAAQVAHGLVTNVMLGHAFWTLLGFQGAAIHAAWLVQQHHSNDPAGHGRGQTDAGPEPS